MEVHLSLEPHSFSLHTTWTRPLEAMTELPVHKLACLGLNDWSRIPKSQNMTQKQLFQQLRWDNPVEKWSPHLCPECVGAGRIARGLGQ